MQIINTVFITDCILKQSNVRCGYDRIVRLKDIPESFSSGDSQESINVQYRQSQCILVQNKPRPQQKTKGCNCTVCFKSFVVENNIIEHRHHTVPFKRHEHHRGEFRTALHNLTRGNQIRQRSIYGKPKGSVTNE